MFIGICSRSQVSVYRTIGPLVPIFSFIFRASYFFLYFDPKSYIFPSNSYIFQNAADNNEISKKNHGNWVEMPVLMSLAFIFFLARFARS